MFPANLTLTPLLATTIFVIAVLAGVNFRRAWKNEGPQWQLWLYGGIAAICLLTVGFVPLET